MASSASCWCWRRKAGGRLWTDQTVSPGERSKHPRSVHVTLFVRITLHFWTQPDQLFWCKFDNGLEFRNDASCAKYMTNRLAGPPLLNQPPGPPLRKPLRPPPVEPTLAPTRTSRPAPCPFSAPFAIIQSITTTYSRKRVKYARLIRQCGQPLPTTLARHGIHAPSCSRGLEAGSGRSRSHGGTAVALCSASRACSSATLAGMLAARSLLSPGSARRSKSCGGR